MNREQLLVLASAIALIGTLLFGLIITAHYTWALP
jgi:hypothetical protein